MKVTDEWSFDRECNLDRQSEFVSASLDTFGVLCHGDLWRQNVLFFYGSGAGSVIECQTDCLDVRFENGNLRWKRRENAGTLISLEQNTIYLRGFS